VRGGTLSEGWQLYDVKRTWGGPWIWPMVMEGQRGALARWWPAVASLAPFPLMHMGGRRGHVEHLQAVECFNLVLAWSTFVAGCFGIKVAVAQCCDSQEQTCRYRRYIARQHSQTLLAPKSLPSFHSSSSCLPFSLTLSLYAAVIQHGLACN
jgi:hypothetical protein